jgi:hypothetical protein
VQRESENPAQPWPRVILDDHSRAVASLFLFVEAPSAFENADIAAQMFYSKWRADRLFLLLPAGALVQQWLKSLAEFPPSVGGEIDFWAACMRRASSMELVPMAEFTIVTRAATSSSWKYAPTERPIRFSTRADHRCFPVSAYSEKSLRNSLIRLAPVASLIRRSLSE